MNMRAINRSLTMLAFMVLLSWKEPLHVVYTDADFQLKNDGLYYRGGIFTGYLIKYSGEQMQAVGYLNGQRHGEQINTNDNGQIARRMFFNNGKRSGKHVAFHSNGRQSYEAEFEDGKHHGNLIKWHQNGQMYSYDHYNHGQLTGHKAWRSNGRIYQNFIYKDGHRLGINGGKLCLSTKDRT